MEGFAEAFFLCVNFVICIPREPPVMIASFPSNGRAAVPATRLVDEARK